MLEVIEKLLILQDRDHRILRVQGELDSIPPQRTMLEAKISNTQAALEAAKLRGNQIESERKKLELEVEAKKQQIEKYSLQQFQTKKNEEYRALAKEIDTCREAIRNIEDTELDLMEKAEAAEKDVTSAKQAAAQAKKAIESQITDLGTREQSLKNELAELESNRDQLAMGVESGLLERYERLLKHKGEKVVVGIDRGVCGGCHMKVPVQLLVSCQAQQEVVSCTNCGRILYYSREMDLAEVD